jgi:polysaccharide export outer membrane protein
VPGTVNTPKAASGSAKPTSGAAKAGAGKPATSAEPGRYILGPLDVVGVSVFDEGHVTGTYSIGPDGRLSLPLISDFKATGLTLPELQAAITEKLGAFIIDPVVNVQLLRNNSKWYTLIGGVLRAGPVQLQRETTILDALAASGGFKDFANPKKIVLRRGTQVFKFNYRDVIHGKHMDQNIAIEDGDIIVVPE